MIQYMKKQEIAITSRHNKKNTSARVSCIYEDM